MKKFFNLIFLMILLVGCSNTSTSTQTKELVDLTFLSESEEVIQVLEDIEVGSTISLPEYNAENHIFVGWQQAD